MAQSARCSKCREVFWGADKAEAEAARDQHVKDFHK